MQYAASAYARVAQATQSPQGARGERPAQGRQPPAGDRRRLGRPPRRARRRPDLQPQAVDDSRHVGDGCGERPAAADQEQHRQSRPVRVPSHHGHRHRAGAGKARRPRQHQPRARRGPARPAAPRRRGLISPLPGWERSRRRACGGRVRVVAPPHPETPRFPLTRSRSLSSSLPKARPRGDSASPARREATTGSSPATAATAWRSSGSSPAGASAG